MLADFGVGQVLWSIVWFTVFFIWIMLAFQVLIDIFRSHDLSGWAKALWLLLILVFPYLGVLIYIIARGGKMHEHGVQQAHAQDAAMRQYIQSAASSPAEELTRLADLKAQGAIDENEFQKLKARVIG